MSAKRFWGAGGPAGTWVGLSKESAAHARVARLRPGEAVELMDGAGYVWRGVWEKDGVRVKELFEAPKPLPEIVLAVGITQGGSSMEDILRQATELGVTTVVPLQSQFAAPRLDPKRQQSKHERWERVVEEACKQCGQYWKPKVTEPQTLAQVWEGFPAARHVVAALAHDAKSWSEMAAALRCAAQIVVWVGPEGDFAPQEYALLREKGACAVRLGPLVLRSTTACVAVLAQLRVALEG